MKVELMLTVKNRRVKYWLRSFLPRSIRKHRILSGPLKGYSIITSWQDYPLAIAGRTELSLFEWFAQKVEPEETWLDVGAHYGYTAIALSRLVGEDGRVFAFEPMLSTAGYLSQTCLLNRFHQLSVIPIALGNRDKVVTTRLPSRKGMVESTRATDNSDWSETILVAKLDWLWPEICGLKNRVDGIKIDVQGMEIETLRGMVEILKTHHPKLVVELHTGVDRAEFLALIAEAGYSRNAIPIEPLPGEHKPKFIDNRSYEFLPLSE